MAEGSNLEDSLEDAVKLIVKEEDSREELDKSEIDLLATLKKAGIKTVAHLVRLDLTDIKEATAQDWGMRGFLQTLWRQHHEDNASQATKESHDSFSTNKTGMGKQKKGDEEDDNYDGCGGWTRRRGDMHLRGDPPSELSILLHPWFKEYKERKHGAPWSFNDLCIANHVLYVDQAANIGWQIYGREKKLLAEAWVDCWFRPARGEDFNINNAVLFTNTQGKKYNVDALAKMIGNKFHKMRSNARQQRTSGPSVPVPAIPEWDFYHANTAESEHFKCSTVDGCIKHLDAFHGKGAGEAVYQDIGGETRPLDKKADKKAAAAAKKAEKAAAKADKGAAAVPAKKRKAETGGPGANDAKQPKIDDAVCRTYV